MIFIVGGKGLTGSAISHYLKKRNLEYENIQKENKEQFFGKSCDILIFANGNALKFKANQEPFFDFIASVASVAEYVHKINFKQFILLSTVDVYSEKSDLKNTVESTVIQSSKLDNYGFHKLLAENYVKKFCDNYLIFRLPGLVGKGLKKNPVFDFINTQKKVMISPDSKLNFISTRFMAESIFKIVELGIKDEIFNLASKNSIQISEIKKITGFDSEYQNEAQNYIQNYQINTEKIQKFIELTTTEQAIKEYFDSLN